MTAHSLAICNSLRRAGREARLRLFARDAVALGVLAAALVAGGQPACAKAPAHAAQTAIKPVAHPAATPAAPVAAAEGDKVAQALAHGDIDTAQTLAEAAVTANPRAAGVRVVLGRVYLRAGRFESAASMLSDARALGDTSGRTTLGLALAKIACGHGAEAVLLLDAAHDTIPVSDYGLALALAGDAPRGVAILGDALHAGDHSPKMRENLAYAYALNGRWRDARMMAANDTPAYKLDARLSQWAETAQPDFARWRVANLIGVPLRADPGVPVSLALAPAGASGGAPETAPALASAVAGSAAPVAPVQTAEAKTDAVAPAPVAVAEVAAPAAQTASTVVAVADAVPASTEAPTAGVAVKTDANGELPALDHAPAALAAITPDTAASPAASPSAASVAAASPVPALAEAAAPVTVAANSVPASGPASVAASATASATAAPDAVVLHRADTTQLVGVAVAVAVAHADAQAAHHAHAQSRHHGGEHLALARQGATGPVANGPVAAGAVPAGQPSVQPAAPTVAMAETHTHPADTAVPTHSRKAHAHKGSALAEASRAAQPVSFTPAGAATHLVQLGSFSSQQNAEHARQTFLARDPALGHRQFVITQALVNGRNFWRVAMMGFDATSAGQTCSAIRHHGGACFAYAAGHLPGGQTLAMNTPGVTPGRDQPARR